jgi:silicon transporter
MAGADDNHSHGVETLWDKIKIVYSLFLVGFSIVVVLALIGTGNTQLARDIHPAAAGIIMWSLIIWMSMVEGGQCSLVGLPPVDRELYRESHPITYKICGWAHKGDNLDRYLMGRQFMVIFINFTIGLCGAPLGGAEVLGLPDWVTAIFLGSGIAMVLQNVVIGQLTSQCNASQMMLDYINTHFMTFTYFVAAGIEVSGVMHSSYLISMIVHAAAGKEVESNEPPKTGATFAFFWLRVLFSCAVLCFGLAVTIEALYRGKTSAWDSLPETVSLILFFVLMGCVGLLEGMQIAFFAVSKLPKSERGSSPMALRTCECLFKNGGKNLPGFMCGRQMTVTLCFFIIARVTTINIDIGNEENIFGVSDPIQKMFNLGFMGALVTTILGSITWQLVAGAFPIGFLSNPIVFIFLQAALFLEATGICSSAWFLAVLQRKALGFQFDEVYIGTPEERAAKGHADNVDAGTDQVHLTTYISATGVGTEKLTDKFRPLSVMQETYSSRREKIIANIKEIRVQIGQATYEGEKEAFEKALELEIASLSQLNNDEMKSKRGFDDMEAIDEEAN